MSWRERKDEFTHIYISIDKRRSQNLKAVPQSFMEVFKVDDVTANAEKTTYLKKRKTTDFP